MDELTYAVNADLEATLIIKAPSAAILDLFKIQTAVRVCLMEEHGQRFLMLPLGKVNMLAGYVPEPCPPKTCLGCLRSCALSGRNA
jgi:hypothetical protein